MFVLAASVLRIWLATTLKKGLIKSVTPVRAGVQSIKNTGFRPSPE